MITLFEKTRLNNAITFSNSFDVKLIKKRLKRWNVNCNSQLFTHLAAVFAEFVQRFQHMSLVPLVADHHCSFFIILRLKLNCSELLIALKHNE